MTHPLDKVPTVAWWCEDWKWVRASQEHCIGPKMKRYPCAAEHTPLSSRPAMIAAVVESLRLEAEIHQRVGDNKSNHDIDRTIGRCRAGTLRSLADRLERGE